MIICVSWEESDRPGWDHERSQQKWRLACQYGGCVIKWEAGGGDGRPRGVWAVNLPGAVTEPEVSSVFSTRLLPAWTCRCQQQMFVSSPESFNKCSDFKSRFMRRNWTNSVKQLQQILNHRRLLVNSALNQKQKSFPLLRLTLVINSLIWRWVLRLIHEHNSII